MFDDTRQVKWCNEKTGTEQVPPPKLYRNPGSNNVHLTIRQGQMAETFIDLGEKQQESQTTFLVNPRRRFHRVFNFQFRDLEPLQVDRFFVVLVGHHNLSGYIMISTIYIPPY